MGICNYSAYVGVLISFPCSWGFCSLGLGGWWPHLKRGQGHPSSLKLSLSWSPILSPCLSYPTALLWPHWVPTYSTSWCPAQPQPTPTPMETLHALGWAWQKRNELKSVTISLKIWQKYMGFGGRGGCRMETVQLNSLILSEFLCFTNKWFWQTLFFQLSL